MRSIIISAIILISGKCIAQEKYISTSDLNLRNGPGTSYDPIGVIKKGDTVTLLDNSESYWAELEFQGKMGYSARKYLEQIDTIEEDTNEPEEESSSAWLILGITGLILFLVLRKRRKKQEVSKKKTEKTDYSITVSVGSRNYSAANSDIIDVNNESWDLSIGAVGNVPYWSHSYVYSYDEIKTATPQQREFYDHLREKVLAGEYVDIEGNTNYAFILYFDLLNEYEKHKDIQLLESHFKLIGEICPRTKSYSLESLKGKLRERSDSYSEERLNELEDPTYLYETGYTVYNPDLYKLGNQYKKKLRLNKQEISWLNKFYNPSNRFNSIEGCQLSIIKNYLTVLNSVNSEMKLTDSTIDKVIDDLFQEVIKIEKLTFSSSYYEGELKWAYARFQDCVFLNFYKKVENSVREKYGHSRKLKLEGYYPYHKSGELINEKLGFRVDELITEKYSQISPPDSETKVELNAQNVNRWKGEFEKIKTNIRLKKIEGFKASLTELIKVNKKNPKVESIFFEAAKFMANHDNVLSLIYYLKYIRYNLASDYKRRELPSNIKKSAFKSEGQQQKYDQIISELEETKDIKAAINQLIDLFTPKKKRIVLDKSGIEETERKHLGTVSLLNEYLNDDEAESEDVEETESIDTNVASNGETSFQLGESQFIAGLNLSTIQIDLIRRIATNSFTIGQPEVDDFAQRHGMFKNQLIDSINEACEEYLDGDVLIEEDDDNYVIEETYYEEILA
ncbi:MAG: tellurite resistance TerB C-terminal domain-containing protein [Bacteroidota bacterium]